MSITLTPAMNLPRIFLSAADNVYVSGSLQQAYAGSALHRYESRPPVVITRLVARGNYLNWLAASKFDVEKEILTGGKYINGVCSSAGTLCYVDSDCPAAEDCLGRLQAESRGCVAGIS